MDSALIEMLRWAAPDSAAEQCEKELPGVLEALKRSARFKVSAGRNILFPSLIELEGHQVRNGKSELALETAGRAWAMLPCATVPVTPRQLEELLLYAALAHSKREDGQAPQAISEVLAVSPRVERPTWVGKKKWADFTAARAKQPLPRTLQASMPKGRGWWDGVPLEQVGEVLPGRHVLQMIGPTASPAGDTGVDAIGQLRTAVVRVNGDVGPAKLDVATLLGLEPDREVAARLVRDLGNGSSTAGSASTIDAYLAHRRITALHFVVSGKDAAELRLLRYALGQGTTVVAEYHPMPPTPDDEKPPQDPPPEKPKPIRGSHLSMGAGVGIQVLAGTPDVFLASGRSIGYQLRVAYALPQGGLELHVAAFPHPLRPPLTSDACGGGESGTEDNIRQAICKHSGLEERVPWAVGLGYARPIPVPGQASSWRVVPSLSVEALYVPYVRGALEGSWLTLADVITAGTVGRLRLGYEDERGAVNWTAGLELEGGVTTVRLGGRWLIACPLGAVAQLGASF